MKAIYKWFRRYYFRIVQSIAFFPGLIALGFLTLVILMLEIDLSGLGMRLNEKVKWLRLEDADTARSIVATVAGGIISLTVFNFSMFMIVLNQAASQMSNRLLENMIGDRFQKLILGFYVGTIVYALFLLSNINEGKDNNYIPSFSIYLLLLFTIIDIFLFIYFLHYITQSFRYEQLIERIHAKTVRAMQQSTKEKQQLKNSDSFKVSATITAPQSGYFQSISNGQLLQLATEQDLLIKFLHPPGTYVLKGTPFLEVSNQESITDALKEKLFLSIDFYRGQPININYYYGFQHLMEVAIKALSPGINDPGTAVLCVHALTDLLAMQMQQPQATTLTDKDGWPRIISQERTIEQIFRDSILPIWHYGREDQQVQKALLRMIKQLQVVDAEKKLSMALQMLQQQVETSQKNVSNSF